MDLEGPQTTNVHDRNSQVRMPIWFVNCPFSSRLTGLLDTFEGLLELGYYA